MEKKISGKVCIKRLLLLQLVPNFSKIKINRMKYFWKLLLDRLADLYPSNAGRKTRKSERRLSTRTTTSALKKTSFSFCLLWSKKSVFSTKNNKNAITEEGLYVDKENTGIWNIPFLKKSWKNSKGKAFVKSTWNCQKKIFF